MWVICYNHQNQTNKKGVKVFLCVMAIICHFYDLMFMNLIRFLIFYTIYVTLLHMLVYRSVNYTVLFN